MLTVTLAMESLLALAFITISLTSSLAITVRNDDRIYDITPDNSELPKSEIEYDQEGYYKPLSRADIQSYQYPPDDNQELNYQLQTRQDTENYQFSQKRIPQTRRTVTKKPIIEQYLKEVTPTTKTAYIQRSGNDIRLRGQPRDRIIKQQAEELQRGILKQQSVQYVLQSDLQEKPQSSPQVQYVLREQKSSQLPENDEPQAEGLTAYQNALLAHQKVLETESQDATSRSSIFVMHSIPKKPVRKIVKPTSTDEIEQYPRIQKLQQKPTVYERQEPAEVRYQTKLEDERQDTNYQASTERPSYQDKIVEYQKLRQHLQDLAQYQQVSTEGPLYQQNPQQVVSYRQVLTENRGKIPSLNTEEVLDYYQRRPKQQISVQYQQPVYVKKAGPKYLPEPKSLRYRPQGVEESEEKYQEVVNIPAQRPEPLISYEAALAKLQAEKLYTIRQPRMRPQITYQSQEPKPVNYDVQNEGQDATPSEQEYVRIGGEIEKYRSSENPAAVVYRQSQSYQNQNPNVRYYRRPEISYPQYQ